MDVINEVCKDLQKRAEKGEKEYGERLRPFNGRNALQDAYEESQDQTNYLKQALIEQKWEVKTIKKIYALIVGLKCQERETIARIVELVESLLKKKPV